MKPSRSTFHGKHFDDRRAASDAGMLDYYTKKGIVSDVEVIDIKKIDEAYDRTLKGDVRSRFVIDLVTL